MRQFVEHSALALNVTAVSRSPSLVGVRYSGSTSDAYVSDVVGIVTRTTGSPGAPRMLQLSDAGPTPTSGRARMWVRSDSTAYDVPSHKRRRAVSICVPIAALAFDLSPFDLVDGYAFEPSPIALHGLRSLAEMAAGDVRAWVARSPAAMDRYLLGVANLVLSAIVDDGSADSNDRDRSWLVTRATALIDAQFYDPSLAPATIATRLGASLRSLHRSFEGRVGVAESLRKRRVEHAATMLTDPLSRRLPITDIAHRCGFMSVATFERSFANEFQLSPHRYRMEASRVAAAESEATPN